MDIWKHDPVFLNDLNVIAYKACMKKIGLSSEFLTCFGMCKFQNLNTYFAEMKDSLMSLDTENGCMGHV